MVRIGVIADDLTGATTTGVLLARSNANTAVFFDEILLENSPNLETLDAVLISTNSRALLPLDAYNEVIRATNSLKNIGTKYFSKRIDTTLRGGIGFEIDAMLDSLGENTIAVMVPSMPQSNRILVGGYSIIEGKALTKTAVAKDVRTPVKENYIPKLIQAQSSRKVGLVDLSIVMKGVDAIYNKMESLILDGIEIIVIDSIDLLDISDIAEASIMLGKNILSVDPGPYTSMLAYKRKIIKKEKNRIPENVKINYNKTALVCVGSATEVTRKQINIVLRDKKNVRVNVDPELLISDSRTALKEIKRVYDIAQEMLNDINPPKSIIFETALEGKLIDLDKEDKLRGYAHGYSAEKINMGLGLIISEILYNTPKNKIAGIYTTGGDTMVNVCRQLGVSSIKVLDYIIPQTDVSELMGVHKGIPIISKGGLTGHDFIVEDIIERLFLESSR